MNVSPSTTVSVVIVNWNAGEQLHTAVQSVLKHGSSFVRELIVVDNGSHDRSLEPLEKVATTEIALRVLRNAENRGFAFACNQGARIATGKLLLFLNPDAALLMNSLRAPVQEFEEDGVGVVGVQLLNERGQVTRTCARFPDLTSFLAHATALDRIPCLQGFDFHMTEWGHDTTRDVDHVIGAFYMIPRSLFLHLGGFDERFFVYLEDLDLSLRVRRAGYRVRYLANAQAFHAGGGVSRQVKARRLSYALRSRLQYAEKNLGRWRTLPLLGVMLSVEPALRLLLALKSGAPAPTQVVEAYKALLVELVGRRRADS